jgi:hypothetical protein
MEVRLTSGLKAGQVIEVDDSVGQAFLASGKAELVEPEVAEESEVAEAPEVVETPERPRGRRGRRAAAAAAAAAPETR